METLLLIAFYFGAMLALRMILVLISKYLAYRRNRVMIAQRPNNIVDRYFFGYIVNTAKQNKPIIKVLFIFNIINTIFTLIICLCIFIQVFEEFNELINIIFAFLYSFQLVYIKVISKQLS